MAFCEEKTRSGKQCSRRASENLQFCWQHSPGEVTKLDDNLSEITDSKKELAKVLTEQFKTATMGISQRVEQQQKLLQFQLVFVGLLVAIFAQNPTLLNSDDTILILQIVPIILAYFVSSHSRHDLIIVDYARFIEHKINPKLSEVIQHSVPSWEGYLAERRKRSRVPLSIFGSDYSLSIILWLLTLLFMTWLIIIRSPIYYSFAIDADVTIFCFVVVIVELLLLISILKMRKLVRFEYRDIVKP